MVHGVLQCFARAELGLVGRRNLDLFPSTGIPTLGRTTVGDIEGSESDDPDFATSAQRSSDGFKNRFHGPRRVCL